VKHLNKEMKLLKEDRFLLSQIQMLIKRRKRRIRRRRIRERVNQQLLQRIHNDFDEDS